MITKKITEVQQFAESKGNVLQVQNSEVGQTSIDTMKGEIVTTLLDNNGVVLNLVNMKEAVNTYADLPTTNLQINDAYQVKTDGLVYTWSGTAFQANGQGFKVQPEVNGVVEEGNTNAVSGGEVYDVISDVLINEPIPKNMKPVSNTAELYGQAVNIYGYGFASLPINDLIGIKFKFYCVDNITNVRVIVKENNVSGTVLHDELFTVNINGVIIQEFIFNTTIENSNKKYIEIYCNGRFGVYRIVPSVTFTQPLGYDFPRFSLINNMGSTTVTNGSASAYYDLYHEIEFLVKNYVFNENAINQIIETANNNLVMPQYVEKSLEITSDLFLKTTNYEGIYEIFNDGTGPQGGNASIGFPVGKLPRTNKITVDIYYDTANVRPTRVKCVLKENSKDGNVVSESEMVVFPNTGVTGKYTIDFNLQNEVNSSEKLYIEIRSNGNIGAYRRHPNTTSIFTAENGYPPFAYIATENGNLVNSTFYFDFYFKTNIIQDIISLTDIGEELFNQEVNSDLYIFNVPNENIRLSLVGSSVTWGDGYLQSGYVKNTIYKMQSQVATSILPEVFEIGTMLNNRKYYNSTALRLDGIGEEIEFELTGNEVSIVQSIERSNLNASEIEVYIDDVLYNTFNNFNPTEIGTETKNFTATGTSNYFDLGRAFTYNHTVTINGVSKVVVMNMIQGTGFTIPSNADCAIIRKLGTRADGTTNVNHFLWLKNTPLNRDEIVITYDYGEELFYEKTTIGSDSAGNNECPYGDGTISFDTTNPSSMGSGLDFRQTDERVVKMYRFLEFKTRKVKLKIKGNYNGSTGTPYFIFNFATNRYFHFQNAGIGGWKIWDFEKNITQDATRGWQRVVEFQPDIMIYETTPNDDWLTKGHKIYKEQTLTLNQLRNVRTLPLREISYQSATDDYKVSKWQGLITAITETSVTFDGTISTPIVKGDVVIIGEYYSRNDEYFERFIDSIDGNTVYFNNPLNVGDVVFDSVQDFIGKGIVIRNYDLYTTKIQTMLENVQESLPSVKIGLLENPMPNCLARELWGYPLILDKLSKDNQFVESINYLSLREWQNSQPKTSVVVNTSNKVFDEVLGKYYIPFGPNGQNVLSTDIKVGNVSIYGNKAVVQNGWAYVVNQTATGNSLNKSYADATVTGQVYNGKQPRVILFDDTISGSLTVEYSTTLWSHDSCHINSNSAQLYADFLNDFLIK